MGAVFIRSGTLDILPGGYFAIIETGERPTPILPRIPGCLLLEPRTSVSDRAIRLAAELQVPIYWVGIGGTRCRALTSDAVSNPARLLWQLSIAGNAAARLRVAHRMFEIRFGRRLHPRHSLHVLRGMEGAEVRRIYRIIADRYRVSWTERETRGVWASNSPLNRAISMGNSCLYGLTEIAVTLAGYSPQPGVVHGQHPKKRRAFVYDIADLVKFDTVVPLAFQSVARGSPAPEWATRAACVSLFRDGALLTRLGTLIEDALSASGLPVPAL